LNLKPVGINYDAKIEVHQGLDLQGGTHLVYQADLKNIADKEKDNAVTGAINVIERRINPSGVSEILIQPAKSLSNEYQIIVELPGVSDPNDAISLIGKTAKMDFRELDATGNWIETGLTGADFKSASVEINSSTGSPEINIEFNDRGATLFGEITKRNLQKPVAIYLDDELLSAPTVQSEISSGRGTISGQFTLEEAKRLAIQLNAGALPIPLKLVEQRNVGATLGKDSIEKSFMAGIVGLLVVALFMIFYYRWPGILAVVALGIYSLITFAVFKNPFQPITLTLAGVAGFILSIGMAVDANILIFERTREELRAGRSLDSAVEQGFKRAWSSIRDSNVSSLITCLILSWLGTGPIRGFAITLAIGILISMFSAITITRTFLRVTEKFPLAKNLWWYGLSKKEIKEIKNA
jgi:preprotein translocase subunit SecD